MLALFHGGIVASRITKMKYMNCFVGGWRAGGFPLKDWNLYNGKLRYFHTTCKSAAQALQAAPSSMYEEAMTTRHLRLGQIFSGTDEHLFRVTKNMRFYSWTTIEVETLFSDLEDSMKYNRNSGGRDYELNQVLVLKESEMMKGIAGIQPKPPRRDLKVWEIADGQQRIVTLALLFSALRDHAVSVEGPTEKDSVEGPTEKEPSKSLTEDIDSKLFFRSRRYHTVPRVRLREKHNGVMQQILEGKNPITTVIKGLPDTATKNMVQNYLLLRKLIKESSDENPEFVEDFFNYIQDNVYIYLAIPRDVSLARKLVSGARRGMDAEPIDEFKSIVVFMGIQDESEQDTYLDRWVQLEEEVTRKCLQDATLIMAQASLGQRHPKNGEVDLLEDYWKAYCNSVDMDTIVSAARLGAIFFDKNITAGAQQLYQFDMAL